MNLVDAGSDIDRETILDITVNLVPIGILAFFVAVFALFDPWEFDVFDVVVTHFLTVFPLVVLAVVTYLSARVISRDEERLVEGEREG